MKRLLLIAVSASLLGMSGAALAKSPHHDDGRLQSEWNHHDNRREHHDRRDWGHERGRWEHHDRYRYDHHRRHDRVVYVTPRRDRRDVYLGVILGPHGAFQYIQRW